MSDLKPLLAGEADELEALLLRAADDDEPKHGALESVGATLGVSAALLTASAASSAAVGQAAALPSAGTVAKPLTLVSLGKWLALGVGVGSVVTGGAHFALEPAHGEKPPAVASTTAVRAERATPALSPKPAVTSPPGNPAARRDDEHAPGPEARTENDAEPTANKPPVLTAVPNARAMAAAARVLPGPSSASFAPLEPPQAATAAPSVAEADAAPASTLGEETRALDRVRADIAAGKANQALGELEQYGTQWPRGSLATEAALLRVEALLRSGRRTQGEREAEALIARGPRSLYATRARALLRATAPHAE